MSRWNEQFDNHPIWDTIRQILYHLKIEFKNTDNEWFTERRRLVHLVELFQSTLGELDAEIVPFDLVSSLESNLVNQILNQTAAFATSGEIGHLQAANDQMANFFNELAILSALGRKSKDPKQVKSLNNLVDEFTKSIADKQTNLESLITDSENTIVQQKVKQAELEAMIEAKKAETDNLIATWQDQFGTAQAKRQSDFEEQLKQHNVDTKKGTDTAVAKSEKTLRDAINHSNQLITERSDETDNRLKAILQDAGNMHEKILALYNIVATDSAVAGYAKDATAEKGHADNWRNGSIIFIGIAVVWLLAAVLFVQYLAGDSLDWKTYPILFSISGVLLYGAVYAAQQSEKHRANERRNKWLALRVNAFEPFVNPLTQEQQNEMRKEICAVLFGDSGTHESSDEDVPTIVSALADAITKILKAVPK